VPATVKGGVHDIGKNLVSVVLGCNGYRVIDLGVMVPADRILDTAVAERADLVGLSGLITPSLDEMVAVAREMARRDMVMPLLIGGATTSRQHTAVRIAPEYRQPVVHVLDASRVTDVVASLLSPEQKPSFLETTRAAQARIREQHGALKRRRMLAWPEAVANRPRYAWTPDVIAAPGFTGLRVLHDVPLQELAAYIDWTLFFSVWELKGRFPGVLDHPQYGAAARELYEHARELLQMLVVGRRLTTRAVYGFWPANSDGDDIVVYEASTAGSRGRERLRFSMLRQQEEIPDGRPNRSLADFIAPLDSGLVDYLGAFAVSPGFGADELVAACERDGNDYDAIMIKALADRLAEAFAEYLHARVRREWGYGARERLSQDDLIAGRFRGIRPAFGYPACPDHSEERKLFALLEAGHAGFVLTESCAILPAASVSGLYFAHPDARYFAVGRVGRDQVEDYAGRKRMPVPEVERWLAQHLGYEPAEALGSRL
jgi:5-methyltetrahydrofolate--homocysteine methyltransferase